MSIVWAIGFLFTWALVSDSDDGWLEVVVTLLFWPIVLGGFVKHLLIDNGVTIRDDRKDARI